MKIADDRSDGHGTLLIRATLEEKEWIEVLLVNGISALAGDLDGVDEVVIQFRESDAIEDEDQARRAWVGVCFAAIVIALCTLAVFGCLWLAEQFRG